MKRLTLLVGTVALLAATSACLVGPDEGRVERAERAERAPPVVESAPLPAGEYPIQSIAYDDATDLYSLFLLDTPPGVPAMYQTQNLRMARLSDDEIAAGKKPLVVVDAEGPVAKLAPDTQIAYTHNVVEERGGEPVVVRQEQSFWSPFMAGMTGAMIGNMLFAPRYYYPPPYAGGGVLGGYGGTGATRSLASADYSSRYGAAPQPARLSKSGFAKVPSSSLKSTGSGAGSSKLSPSKSAPQRPKGKPFGGRGFGRRR